MIARATVRPPTPESKMPIGAVFVASALLEAAGSETALLEPAWSEPAWSERAVLGPTFTTLTLPGAPRQELIAGPVAPAGRRPPSALLTMNAASRPPSAPNRCACQETVTTPVMSAAATRTMPVQNSPPYSASSTTPSAMCCQDRVNTPRAMRTASQPKTIPEAPRVTELAGAMSHTPSPETSQTTAVTAMNCRTPPSMINTPKMINGTRLEKRCPQDACTNGAVSTFHRSDRLRGSTPKESSR